MGVDSYTWHGIWPYYSIHFLLVSPKQHPILTPFMHTILYTAFILARFLVQYLPFFPTTPFLKYSSRYLTTPSHPLDLITHLYTASNLYFTSIPFSKLNATFKVYQAITSDTMKRKARGINCRSIKFIGLRWGWSGSSRKIIENPGYPISTCSWNRK